MSPHRSRHRGAGRASGTPAAGQCDAAGNMTSLQTGGDTGTTYTEKWNAWGRPVKIEQRQTARRSKATPTTATGRRIELTSYDANGDVTGVTHYYLSGQQVIQTSVTAGQTNPVPTIFRTSTSGRPAISSPILRDTYSGGTEVPATFRAGGFIIWTTRTTMSPRWCSTTPGAWGVAERYQYDPDGNVTVLDHRLAAGDDAGDKQHDPLRRCELDGVTGLYYMRARYYDPALNRFISRDPLGYAGAFDQPVRVLR